MQLCILKKVVEWLHLKARDNGLYFQNSIFFRIGNMPLRMLI